MIDEDSSITVNSVLFISVTAEARGINYVKGKSIKGVISHTNLYLYINNEKIPRLLQTLRT